MRNFATSIVLCQWLLLAAWAVIIPSPPENPVMPSGPPRPAPDYMVDNRHNFFGHAPDKGIMNGPITSDQQLNSYIALNKTETENNSTVHSRDSSAAQAGAYWMADITHGQMPKGVPSGYQFFRNVQLMGATGSGTVDDTVAINNAASSGGRCDVDCGASSTLGAIIYFPPGEYLISAPIVQYYYTLFIGDANNPPTIKGSANFTGIALIDTDVYIPGGAGAEWYINQNQFYRSIRNFVIDLTGVKNNTDKYQDYVPTGIHWQVAQATSLQNIHFKMPVSTGPNTTSAVGVFMENGSGGYVEDLIFEGGNIGFRAGSQQFTARNLQFTSCLTAISSIWNWSFTWKNIYVYSCQVAIDCTQVGGTDLLGDAPQGTGSITVLDSLFDNVLTPITLNATWKTFPGIVLENVQVEGNTKAVVSVTVGGSESWLPGSGYTIQQWAMGRRYTSIGDTGEYVIGLVPNVPTKDPSLLSNGAIFSQSKPLYTNYGSGDFIIATAHGVANDGNTDSYSQINTLLAGNVGKPVYFPAGIYLVSQTVRVPVGSIIIGEAWSQIMGTGKFFSDQANPKPVVQVGKAGDVGIIQMTDLLFTVQGGTAGAILVEWNVHESTQGSAAMWDCHFRVGGAIGSNLQQADCPTGGTSSNCYAASLLMHVTPQASGYFANVWAWVADHDIDVGGCDGLTTNCAQISIFAGRGILIESQGPTWLYGTAAEHSVLYQYQVLNAKNLYMGLIQTETPYFQPDPNALSPYTIGAFPSDPTFDECGDSDCTEAWALRILNSTDVYIYGAGLYSFFSNYDLSCNKQEQCQQSLIQTSFTQGLWIYNLATKGVVEMVSPAGGILPTYQADGNQAGYTTEISIWSELGMDGADLGENFGSNDTGTITYYTDPDTWSTPNIVFTCPDQCVIIVAPQPLSTTTTITFPLWTTLVSYSTLTTRTTTLNNGNTTAIPGYSMITVPTVITIPPVTTTAIDVWAITITSGQSPGPIYMTSSVEPDPFVITITPTIGGSTSIIGGTTTTQNATTDIFPWLTWTQPPTTETVGGSTTVIGGVIFPTVLSTVTPPPYPTTSSQGSTKDTNLNTASTSWSIGPPTHKCKHNCGHHCIWFCIKGCPLCPPGLGCPFCPPGIGPPPGNTPGGSGDGENDSSSECETVTTSSCFTPCTASSTPSCGNPSCSTIISCDATGSSSSGTVIFADAILVDPCTIDEPEPSLGAAVQSAMDSFLSSIYAGQTYQSSFPTWVPSSGPEGSIFSGSTAPTTSPATPGSTPTTTPAAPTTSPTTTPSSQPTTLPIPPGTSPNWIMYGTSETSGQGGSITTTFGMMGYAADGINYDPCSVSGGDNTSANSDDTPIAWSGIKNVFGDTCNYVITTSSFSNAAVGDPVGQLNCPDFAAAQCVKMSNTDYPCVGISLISLTRCNWT